MLHLLLFLGVASAAPQFGPNFGGFGQGFGQGPQQPVFVPRQEQEQQQFRRFPSFPSNPSPFPSFPSPNPSPFPSQFPSFPQRPQPQPQSALKKAEFLVFPGIATLVGELKTAIKKSPVEAVKIVVRLSPELLRLADLNGNGLVDQQDLQMIHDEVLAYHKSHVAGKFVPLNIEQDFEEFAKLDADGSGHVDLPELINVIITRLDSPLWNSLMQFYVQSFDTEELHKGYISPDEKKAIADSIAGKVEKMEKELVTKGAIQDRTTEQTNQELQQLKMKPEPTPIAVLTPLPAPQPTQLPEQPQPTLPVQPAQPKLPQPTLPLQPAPTPVEVPAPQVEPTSSEELPLRLFPVVNKMEMLRMRIANPENAEAVKEILTESAGFIMNTIDLDKDQTITEEELGQVWEDNKKYMEGVLDREIATKAEWAEKMGLQEDGTVNMTPETIVDVMTNDLSGKMWETLTACVIHFTVDHNMDGQLDMDEIAGFKQQELYRLFDLPAEKAEEPGTTM